MSGERPETVAHQMSHLFEMAAPRSPQPHVLRTITLFYIGMGALGLALLWWRRDAFEMDALGLPTSDWPLHSAVAIILTLAVHLASRWAHRQFRSFRAGARDVYRLLGNLSTAQIALVAMTSGIGEELLFRGYLTNETGLWISSILFGLIHIPPNKKWLYWPAFAALMGVMLGWLYLWTGSLVYPIVLHAGVNFLNLRMMLPATAAVRPSG